MSSDYEILPSWLSAGAPRVDPLVLLRLHVGARRHPSVSLVVRIAVPPEQLVSGFPFEFRALDPSLPITFTPDDCVAYARHSG